MKQSQYFLKTRKTASQDEPTVNGRLLEQAGYVDKLMAGVYSYLPIGYRVLNKISRIVREEMDALGASELLMPMLHPKENWQTTGGWDNIDVLFKINSRTERQYALGQSEEEVVTPLIMSRVQSYKDLPLAVYQIGWKFRDELRAKSGLLRGREFLMKDMYSFHTSQEDFDRFYAEAKRAYFKVFQRLGLTAKATEASGGSFSTKISYEFMVLTDAGEDDILYCNACDYCVNVEITNLKAGDGCPKNCGGTLAQAKASEVGNVFDLGQKYGKDFDLGYMDESGNKQYPIMGCYGIGISRLMGVIAETMNDEKGLLWPESVAPFKVHLIGLNLDNSEVRHKAEKVCQDLQQMGIEVLYDDRENASAGEKFADSDLIGIPYRVVVSSKSLAQESVELKKRNESTPSLVNLLDIVKTLH